MQPHAARGGSPVPRWHGHVDEAAPARAHPELRRGGVVAQRGFLPAREHRSKPEPIGGEARVTDGVDPAMDRVQAPGSHPACDRGARQPEREQLRDRHHPVLARGEGRDAGIDMGRVEFGSHTDP